MNASSQASFTDGGNVNGCLTATNLTDSGDITIQGSTILQGRCGLVALSNSATSIVVNGNPTLDVGWVASRGGISDYFNSLQDTQVMPYLSNLTDQFSALTPPTNSATGTCTCTNITNSTTTGTDTTTVTTNTYSGSKQNSLTLTSTATGSEGTPQTVNRSTVTGDQNGTYTTSTTTTGTVVDNGSKANPRYTRTDTVTSVVHVYTITTTTIAAGTMTPGTFAGGVSIGCDTTMQPGIYVMNGGDFQTNAQYTVTGSGVMIVLTNGAGIVINGGASINLTAMSSSQLQSLGVPNTGTSSADKLAGMLFFEDRSSPGASKNHNKLNGNASTTLNGTIYLPVSNITMSGTANVTSQCLMISASNITLSGNLDMTTFCPANITFDEYTSVPVVKLVA